MHHVSRRGLLACARMAAVAMACEGIARGATAVDAPALAFVYEAVITLAPMMEIGKTPIGVRRRVPITGGHFAGPELKGKILAGGADWQLQRADNWTVIDADYMMEASDGTLIHVRNVGLTNSRVPGVTQRYMRTIPSFEAPDGPLAWLNQAMFVGTIGPPPSDMPGPAVVIRVYRVT